MTESWKFIPAADGKRIYYLETHGGSARAERCIVIGHGLTGHAQEYLHQVATPYFVARGYDVVRIAFYHMAEDARKLPECTLAIHASDLNQLIEHLSPLYQKIFVTGHSYGGLTLLLANPDAALNVRGIAFWDSSYVPEFWDEAIYIPEIDQYKHGWGVYSLIGRAMVEEGRRYTREYAKSLAARIDTPSLVVLAKLGAENRDETALYDDLTCQKRLAEIQGSHCFYEKGAAERLAEVTEAFFSKL